MNYAGLFAFTVALGLVLLWIGAHS